MKHFVVAFGVLFVLEVASQSVRLSNGWTVAYPCRDNRKVSLVVVSSELSKGVFQYVLAIEGINKNTNKFFVSLEIRNRDGVYNRHDFQFPVKPGRSAFSAELTGNGGQLPNILSITANGVNYCKNPNNLPTLHVNNNFNYITQSPLYTNAPLTTNVYVTPNKVTNPPPRREKPDYLIVSATQTPVTKPEATLTTDRFHSNSANQNSCGVRQIHHLELITNGLPTQPGDWPWHAALYIFEGNSINYVCGGTLISQFTVLTAAHCVTMGGNVVIPDILNVVLGKHKLYGGDETVQDKKAFRIIVYEHTNKDPPEKDVALIKLKTQVIYNSHVQPACLWHDGLYQRLSSTNNIIGMVAGWGIDSKHELTYELMQASLPKVSNAMCIESNYEFFSARLNSYNFCVGWRNGTSACNGDSGGGFHVFVPEYLGSNEGRWYVHGVVSLAVRDLTSEISVCDSKEYLIFSDVGKFSEWISKNI